MLSISCTGVLHPMCFSYLLFNVRVIAQFPAGVPFIPKWTFHLLSRVKIYSRFTCMYFQIALVGFTSHHLTTNLHLQYEDFSAPVTLFEPNTPTL